MIAQPGVRVVQSPGNNVIEVTWEHKLKGKLSPIKKGRCRMRLGRGDKKEKITWKSSLDCRGDYQNGHIKEYLEDKDIPQSGEGKNVYAQFLFEPVYVVNDETNEIEENHDGEVIFSNIALSFRWL